ASRAVHIFLDLHRDRRRGLGSKTTRRSTARLTASVAAYAMFSGHQVSLHGEGSSPIYLPPRGGQHQLTAILDVLVDIEQEGQTPLNKLLQSNLSHIGEHATVVLIVPTTRINPDDYVESLAILEGRQAIVLVLLIDDRDLIRYDGEAEEYERDWSLEELERSFRSQGAWCRSIVPGDSISDQFPSEEFWTRYAS
ncbi:MAG: hypothetical protein ABEJ65_07280, partial [bacterium]